MNTARRALRNSSILMTAQILTWTSTLLLTAAVGRELGGAGFGDLYLAMSFVAIFSVLVEFGMHQQLVRAIARDPNLASAYLINSIVVKVLLFAASYSATVILIQLLNYPAGLKVTIAIYSLVLLSSSFAASLAAVYQAHERVFYPTLVGVLEKVCIMMAAIFMLHRGYGITTIAAIYVVISLLATTVLLFSLVKTIPLNRSPVNLQIVRGLVLGGLPFLLYNILSSVYYRIDIVLLSKLTDQTVVGWYGAAYRLFDTLSFLPGIIAGAVLYPILSRLSLGSRADLRLAVAKGLDVMLMLGTPICVGLFVLAGPIVRLIYRRPEFAETIPALQWLALGLFFMYVNYMLTVAVWSLNQERRMIVCAGLAGVLNLALNWTLIPHFGHLAAAAVTVGTEFFVLGYVLIIIPKDLLCRRSLTVFGKSVMAAAIMASVLYALGDRSLLILVPAGVLVYALSAWWLRLVPVEDARLVRGMILRRRTPASAVGEA